MGDHDDPRPTADPDERGVSEGHGRRNAWFVDPFGTGGGTSSPQA